MITVTYSSMNMNPLRQASYVVRKSRFENLQSLKNWLGCHKPEKVSLPQPDSGGTVNPIKVETEGEVISIHLIQNDCGVLFSTGGVRGTHPHISSMIFDWLKDCEAQRQQAIRDDGLRYIP